MHEFAERGIASHWIYKSSEKVSHLALKEYDWLRDLVEIMEKGYKSQNIFWNIPNYKCFKTMFFVLLLKVKLLNYQKEHSPIDFAYAVHTKIGDNLSSCEINGRGSPLTKYFKKW